MRNSRQNRDSISAVSLRAPRIALALAVTMALAIFVVLIPMAQGQTFTTVYTFTGGTDGAFPNGLIQDAAGNLYGTTQEGGTGKCNGNYPGCGVVFKVTKAGKETILYSFPGKWNGVTPWARVISDSGGNLYGTTFWGGGASNDGIVFKVDKTGKETVLHRFTGSPDGAHPYAGLIRDASGDLYGTTGEGGQSDLGTVFKVSKGKLTVLHSFAGSPDGATPYAGLIQDAAGYLYGTTSSGGTYGDGTVFRMTKAGDLTVLYSFAGKPDGQAPNGLVRDAEGNLYSTTSFGGDSDFGTVFKLDTNGVETILHSFAYTDGAYPGAGLVRDAPGNLYGTTADGGKSAKWCNFGCGVVFKLTANGKETTLHFFDFANGANPASGLVRDAQGNLYGTLPNNHAAGAIFKITP